MSNKDNKQDIPDDVFDELMSFGKKEEKKQQNLSKNSGGPRYQIDDSARNHFLR